MSSAWTARSTAAVNKTDASASISSDPRPDRPQVELAPESAPAPTDSGGMSDTMRTIVWITGVAFGVAAPGAFAQAALNASTTQTKPAFQEADAYKDGFVNREVRLPLKNVLLNRV